jgi:hypothetical protein
MPWTLVSKAVVAALHTVDADSLQDEWSEWVEDMIQDRVGIKYLGTTATITDETHNGNGTLAVYVKYPPIVSVASLSIGTSTPSAISSSSYKVFTDRVELINSPGTATSTALRYPNYVFPVGTQNIQVSYTSGLDTVPPHVQFIAARMVAEVAKSYQRMGSDGASRYIPAQQSTGAGKASAIDRGLEGALEKIVATLRRRYIPLG